MQKIQTFAVQKTTGWEVRLNKKNMAFQMTKQTLVYFTVLLTAITVSNCKNKATENQSKSSGDAAVMLPEKTDSLMGFEGCSRAGFKMLSPQVHEFKYQDYTFRITNKEDGAESIEAVLDSTGRRFKVPDVEPTYFRGAARGHFFVDVGTAPDVRELIVYSLTRESLSQVYRTQYLLEEPPFVAESGSLWFYVPVPESEVAKELNCPDKADWLKKDLKVGYGQRYLYNMVNRGLTRKSEFICAPLQ